MQIELIIGDNGRAGQEECLCVLFFVCTRTTTDRGTIYRPDWILLIYYCCFCSCLLLSFFLFCLLSHLFFIFLHSPCVQLAKEQFWIERMSERFICFCMYKFYIAFFINSWLLIRKSLQLLMFLALIVCRKNDNCFAFYIFFIFTTSKHFFIYKNGFCKQINCNPLKTWFFISIFCCQFF